MRRLFIPIVVFGSLTASFAGCLMESKDQTEKQTRVLTDQENTEEAFAAGADVIAETAVATINGERVPVSSYIAEDSSFDGGPSMSFHLPTGVIDVTIGSTFEVGSKQYEIFNIWEDEDGHGYVAYLEISTEAP